ncbi:hypothetical protein LRD18_12735, partial [Halorhodospira halochloris]|uniref:hypothetical protein n=1 Tax=Halorhodospira halochloris TaxID=1052 RepID=UPI001EE7D597
MHKTQMMLAGQGAVLCSYADSLQESEGISPTALSQSLATLNHARCLHKRLEASIEAVRTLLIEHDA